MSWTTTISGNNLLGVGVYAPNEAASFAGVRAQQIIRWIHGSGQGEPVVDAQFAGHREIITFLDMVQAMAVRELRKAGCSLPKIRQAAQWVRKHYREIRYPFAVEHRTYIVKPTKQIVIVRPHDDPEKFVQVSGGHKGQLVHPQLLDQYLQQLVFGTDGLATRFVPLQEDGRRIVLDPKVRFGQPRVEPCGYMVETLVRAAQAERSVDAAAWWYKIDKADVGIAVRYRASIQECVA
jgi:uncharacterized protein (DUF433 family)